MLAGGVGEVRNEANSSPRSRDAENKKDGKRMEEIGGGTRLDRGFEGAETAEIAEARDRCGGRG